jgi:hypothetical protein
MDNILDLTKLDTQRVFVVGELNGDHSALMRLLYQQRFGHKDTLITTGNFFNIDSLNSLDLTVFLRNAVSCYSVIGEQEIKLLQYLEDPEKEKEIRDKLKNKLSNYCLEFICSCPPVIKYKDYYIMHAGVDPSKALDDQDPTVFFSIGEYDKDSRFYQYPNPEKASWYNTPYLVNGKHVKICFSRIYLEDIEVPAGYNLGRNTQINSGLRCLVLDKTQGAPSIITSM